MSELADKLADCAVKDLLLDGDYYSVHQLKYATQQALVLREYYQLLHRATVSGQSFSVYDMAARAGTLLGKSHTFDHRTVRTWHVHFIRDRQLHVDGLGNYEREILILE
eukprot:6171915-Pleurochrysis_carterae.AAC.2